MQGCLYILRLARRRGYDFVQDFLSEGRGGLRLLDCCSSHLVLIEIVRDVNAVVMAPGLLKKKLWDLSSTLR